MAKSMRIASLAPFDVLLCLKHLRFGEGTNFESTFGACFSRCHFDILPVTPTILTTCG